MDKLQQALEKARQKRADRPAGDGIDGARNGGLRVDNPATGSTPRGRARSPRSGDGAAAWAALSPIAPSREHLARRRVFAMGMDEEARQFDILRTKVTLQMRKHGWRRLAITSPAAACGKTTIACNLAAGFARQGETRAILFDLDLRQPAVAKLFGHEPETGITALLDGSASFAEQAVRLGDTVALSLARRGVSDPTRHLISERTARRLDEVEAEMAPDLMLFDLPPVLVSDDTRAFLKNVDCALIVARAESTSVAQIDVCEKEIAELTNVLGVVLNSCRFVGDEAGYDAAY